jgi:hypothetical protein
MKLSLGVGYTENIILLTIVLLFVPRPYNLVVAGGILVGELFGLQGILLALCIYLVASTVKQMIRERR